MASEDLQNLASVPVVYSNNVRLALSFSDFKIFFGEFIPPNVTLQTGQIAQAAAGHMVDRVCVALSPDLIPAMIDGLKKAVETYTAQFGPLRTVPPVMLQSVQATSLPKASDK